MDRSLLVRRVAPVAVFVAVLGGIGLLGQRHRGDTRLEPIPLGASGRGEARNASGADAASAPGIAAYGGKVVVPDSLLAGLPERGDVYRMDEAVATERIAALARALGISGEVRTDEQGWVVGTGDRVLRVTKSYGASWFLGPVKDGVVSSGAGGSATDVAVAAPPPCPSPAPDEKPTCTEPYQVPSPVSPPPAPSEDSARAAAAPVLAALDLAGAVVGVEDGWGTKDVVAKPVVGGLTTYGIETRISVDVRGDVAWASGFLGRAAVKGTYPLLDVRAAVERGSAYGIEPMMGAPCEVGKTCATAAPDRVATAVRLGLLFSPGWETGDDAFLTPAWVLTFDGDVSPMPVLALPDAYVATPPPDAVRDGGGGGSAEPGDAGDPGVQTIAPEKPAAT